MVAIEKTTVNGKILTKVHRYSGSHLNHSNCPFQHLISADSTNLQFDRRHDNLEHKNTLVALCYIYSEPQAQTYYLLI